MDTIDNTTFVHLSSDRDSKKLLQAQLTRDYKFVKPSLTKECKDLINEHLNPNPSTRVNMNEVLAHEWFGVDKKASTESQDKSTANE